MKKKTVAMLVVYIVVPLLFTFASGETMAYPSLKDFYAPYFDFGSAMSTKEATDTTRTDFYVAQYSIVTPENALKPENVIDVYNSSKAAKSDQGSVALHFNAAKPLLEFAMANGLKVNGHVLFWHQQTPDTFFRVDYLRSEPYVSRDVLLARMENYVRLMMAYLNEHYPGLVVSWDVVNEAIDDSTGGFRQSNYTKIIGEDWVVQAFRFARKYAPEGTLLVYNDYSVPYQPKFSGISNLLDSLLVENLVDVCGMQCHYQLSTPSIAQFRFAIEKIIAKGLKIRVTELDILVDDNSAASFQKQAVRYTELMKVLLKYSDSVLAVQTWGTYDTQSWKSGSFPLLFNGDGSAKPAFYALTDPAILP
ncbi:MAG TPA: endo-1,4-beta-xylanase [Candidatus Limiplasma sp.]|nr:endo-1,4-beta-xylanase [Candidatus Limiplasma sp.]HRX08412.1 endo-1,4-beta-xylanase [Candidatus Limiplasma sp.]